MNAVYRAKAISAKYRVRAINAIYRLTAIFHAWALAAAGAAPVFAARLTPEAGSMLVTPASFCGTSRFVKQYWVDHWYGLRGGWSGTPVNATVQT